MLHAINENACKLQMYPKFFHTLFLFLQENCYGNAISVAFESNNAIRHERNKNMGFLCLPGHKNIELRLTVRTSMNCEKERKQEIINLRQPEGSQKQLSSQNFALALFRSFYCGNSKRASSRTVYFLFKFKVLHFKCHVTRDGQT